jgi:nucleotide-binding universal stress UspA family protein
MTSIRSILVATDFSADARAAAQRAALLAKELEVERAMLLHVLSPSPPAALLGPVTEGAGRALAALADEIHDRDGFAFEPKVTAGTIVNRLCSEAERFDLLVTGARGLHPFRDFALGSTPERLLRRSRRPVLVVKRAPQERYRNVLVGVDFSRSSKGACRLARAVAPRAPLKLVHAFQVSFESTLRFASVPDEQVHRYRREARERSSAGMEQLFAELGWGPEHATRFITHGYAPSVLTETADEANADLVVLGKHGESRLAELLLGSVTLHVLQQAPCDVLVTPRA